MPLTTYRPGTTARYSHAAENEAALAFTLIEDKGDRVAGGIPRLPRLAHRAARGGEQVRSHRDRLPRLRHGTRDDHECEPLSAS